ncbi:hypothetical protein J6590_097250 [Homalodisca vitripennis]|nr:hypothetical protein J6590_097250 [Homalodisca vitripennis]
METWVNYAAFLSIFSLAVCHDHSRDYLHFHSKSLFVYVSTLSLQVSDYTTHLTVFFKIFDCALYLRCVAHA